VLSVCVVMCNLKKKTYVFGIGQKKALFLGRVYKWRKKHGPNKLV
jgi:hypothetical protein